MKILKCESYKLNKSDNSANVIYLVISASF